MNAENVTTAVATCSVYDGEGTLSYAVVTD
jgi:hypothetical protein